MSVTFSLYRIRDDVDYINSPYSNGDVRTPENTEEYYKGKYTDNNKHDMIDISYVKSMCYKGKKLARGAKRAIKPIKNLKYKLCKTTRGYAYKYVTVDEVLYRQGWFLKKKFFNRELTFVFCNSKKQMQRFFNEYIDRSTERGKECEKAFMDAFQPGMIFECAF